uniref:receptor protein-tyrosine kinase n=2 Tax=Stomoxys calcitrans TaxID=35570 RepID=A0A1I8NXE3_STOCA
MRLKGFVAVLRIIIILICANAVCASTNKPKRSSDKIHAGYAREIFLVEAVLQSQQVKAYENINIFCPFEQPQWYHNKTAVYANKSLEILRITSEKKGLYSCVSQFDKKWANVTIGICDAFCQIKPFSSEKAPDIPGKLEVSDFVIQFNKSIVKYYGDAVTISCLPSIRSATNTTWTLNKTALNGYMPRMKIKKSSLTIVDLKGADSGIYTCQQCNLTKCIHSSTELNVVLSEMQPPLIIMESLHNQSVNTHSSTELNVVLSEMQPPLIIIESLHNQSVNIDDNTFFDCIAVREPESHIIWFRHSMPLNLTSTGLDVLKEPHVRKMITQREEPHILRLGRVQKEDEGWYTCLASNVAGEKLASGYLNVVEPSSKQMLLSNTRMFSSDAVPLLNTLNLEQQENDELSDHEVEYENKSINDIEERPPEFKNTKKLIKQLHKPAGSSIQLSCPATGNPMPNITWTQNDTEIERHIGKVTYKKWSIQMDDAITKDSGVYKCKICNKLGCIEHATKITIFDRLRSRPIISDKFPQNQTVVANSSSSLECRVVSDLEPYIFWLKYSKKNESIEKLEKLAQNYAVHEISNKTTDVVVMERDPDKPNILSFVNTTHDDEGWYTCVAASSLGQTVASAYLKVVDKLPQRDGLQRSHPAWITTVGIVVVLLFLFGTIFIIYVLRNLKHEKELKQRIETVHQWTKKVIIYKPPTSEGSSCDLQMPVIKIEKQRTTFTTSTNSDPTQGFNEYEFPLDSNWEIARSQLTLGSTLGEGAFGRVVMAQGSGFGRGSSNGSTATIVAVKMVKEEHTDADMASLVREMEVMKMIGKHKNIINLLGCCSQNGPLWVIVEYAPHGNLKDFLKKNRPVLNWGSCSLKRNTEYLEEGPVLNEKHLTSFAFQIARGMEYLASRRCIHRDLAARNVLVSDDYIMKIADFGLARDIQDTDYYRKNTNGRLPIKWMAPESLQEKFYDSQSDVWSYGVLLWEILTYGEQPYPNIMSAEELYGYLITGQRMEKPPRCSLNIYMLMRQCWHFDSSARPTFSEIVENLDKLLQLSSATSNDEYLDLSIPMLETPPSSDDDSDGETFLESTSNRYQYTYKFN